MRHFYTGLLFFGASIGAHAAEIHKHSHTSRHAPAAMHYTHYVPEKHEHNSVVYSDFKSAKSGVSAPQLATSEYSATELSQSQRNLVNVLSALHYQRMVLQNEQLKLSFRPGTAEIESGHVKVAVHSDSTSVTWQKTF